jgi:hypothetical protein
MTHPLRPSSSHTPPYGGVHEWYFRRAREMARDELYARDPVEEFSNLHWPRLHRELMRHWATHVLDTAARTTQRVDDAATRHTDEYDDTHELYDLEGEPYEYDVEDEPEPPPPNEWQRQVRAKVWAASELLEEHAWQLQEGAYLDLYNALQAIFKAANKTTT